MAAALAGVVVVGALMGGGGPSTRTMITKIASDVVARAFLHSTQSCRQAAKLDQNMVLNCNPPTQDAQGNPLGAFEDQPVCRRCLEAVPRAQREAYALYRRAWETQGKVVIPEFDADMGRWMSQLEGCIMACKACVFTNLNQNQVFQWETNCQIDSDTLVDMQASVRSQVAQEMQVKTDLLSSMFEMFGAKTNSDVVINISNRINSRLTVKVMQDLRDEVSFKQYIGIGTASSSVSHVSQEAALTALSDAAARMRITANILSTSELSALQRIESNSSTLDAAGNFVKNTLTTFGATLESTTGAILIYAILGSLILMTLLNIYISIMWGYKFKKNRLSWQRD